MAHRSFNSARRLSYLRSASNVASPPPLLLCRAPQKHLCDLFATHIVDRHHVMTHGRTSGFLSSPHFAGSTCGQTVPDPITEAANGAHRASPALYPSRHSSASSCRVSSWCSFHFQASPAAPRQHFNG